VQPRIALNYNDAIKSLVAAGYGAALLPHEAGAPPPMRASCARRGAAWRPPDALWRRRWAWRRLGWQVDVPKRKANSGSATRMPLPGQRHGGAVGVHWPASNRPASGPLTPMCAWPALLVAAIFQPTTRSSATAGSSAWMARPAAASGGRSGQGVEHGAGLAVLPQQPGGLDARAVGAPRSLAPQARGRAHLHHAGGGVEPELDVVDVAHQRRGEGGVQVVGRAVTTRAPGIAATRRAQPRQRGRPVAAQRQRAMRA
jgi:hypothetical protein